MLVSNYPSLSVSLKFLVAPLPWFTFALVFFDIMITMIDIDGGDADIAIDMEIGSLNHLIIEVSVRVSRRSGPPLTSISRRSTGITQHYSLPPVLRTPPVLRKSVLNYIVKNPTNPGNNHEHS